MRKVAVGIVVAALVVAGGAYYGIAVYPQQRFRSELNQAIARLPAGISASYKAADYAPLANRATVSGIAIGRAAPDNFEVAIDELTVTKPAVEFLKDWAAAVANPATLKPDTALPLGQSVALRGLSFKAATTTGSADTLQVDGLRVYPWALLHEGVPSWTAAQAAMAANQPQPKFENIVPLLKLEAAIMLGTGYDRYEMSGLEATAEVPDPTGAAVTFNYVIGKMAAGAYDRGKGRSGTGEQIRVAGAVFGTFTADRVAVTGIDARSTLNQFLEGTKPSPSMLDSLAIGSVEYAGMAITPTGGTAIPIGTFTMGKLGFSHGMPVSLELAYSGLHVTSAQIPQPQVTAVFQQLGLDAATLSFGLSYDYDPDQQRLALHEVRLKVDELGMIELSLDATGFVPGAAMQTAAQLAHARLRYTDASLTERALRANAAMTGNDLAALRQQLVDIVRQQAAAFGDSPAIAAAAKAIIDFIGAPQSLTVELAPPAPVPLAVLQAAAALPPARLAAMLGLSVAANQ